MIIQDNTALTTLSGLNNLTTDDLVLENDALPTGAAAALVAEIDYVVGGVVLQD